MDQVHVVRHKVLVEGRSLRAVAREMDLSRNTVRRYLELAEPVRVEAAPRPKPVLEQVGPRLEALLGDSPRWTGGKQRLTAARLHEMLLAEGLTVGATTVKAAVAEWKRRRREVFVPLVYRPGELAEVDFFEVLVDIDNERRKAWMFVMRLMHSERQSLRNGAEVRERADVRVEEAHLVLAWVQPCEVAPTALGVEAARQRRRVLFTRAADLVQSLVEARDARELGRLQRRLQRVDLLIIDELGFVPFDRTGGELLFNVIAQRYERRSVIVTTNLPFAEWVKVFGGDEKLTTALLDRLAHHATIIATKGRSYRMRKKAGSRQAKDDNTLPDAPANG